MSQRDQINGSDVYNYSRDSFSDRFTYDYLCEDILEFLPIKDKFRFECVSKQFQRTVYQKHYKLINTEEMHKRSDTDFEKSLYFIRPKDINNFKTILQKLPHIRSLESDIPLNDSEIDLIIKYCNHLSEFNASLEGVSDTSKQLFGNKFGSQLTSIRLDLSYKSIIKSLVNIQQIFFNVDHYVFINLMPLVITKNLKKVKLYSGLDSQFNDVFDCLKRVTRLRIEYYNQIDIRYVSQLNQLISLEVVVDQPLVKSMNNFLNHLALNGLKLKEFILCFHRTNNLKTEDFMSKIKKFKALKRFSMNYRSDLDPIRFIGSKFEDYFKHSMKSGFQNLTHLTINFKDLKLNEKFLENIAIYLPNLRYLTINSKIRVTERTVDYMSRLSNLETLVLNITDNSLNKSFLKSFKKKLSENCTKFHSFSIIREKPNEVEWLPLKDLIVSRI